MNLKNYRSPTQKCTYHIITFIWHSRKFKLLYSDEKQICACLGPGLDGGLTEKEHNGTFGDDAIIYILIIVMATRVFAKTHQLNTLNGYSLFYINYTSVKMILSKKILLITVSA